MSELRKELTGDGSKSYCPKGGTAYLMIYSAVEQAPGLIHGKLHDRGAHCAIGNFFEINKKLALETSLIDEVAAVNDSVPFLSELQRKKHVLRWLKWKLQQQGMVFKGKKIAKP